MKMPKITESQTITIRRSQINLNPLNPKHHSEESVAKQRKNIQKVGFFGGIVWNSKSGNLIDGHRRIKALDVINKYNGTPETDYSIKVESIAMDDKQEKEQMTFMAAANTRINMSAVGAFISDIDYSAAGLSAEDYQNIMAQVQDVEILSIASPLDDLITPVIQEEPHEDRKSKVKEAKRQAIESAGQRQDDLEAYITLSFSSHENKVAFLELIGESDPYTKFVKGELVLSAME